MCRGPSQAVLLRCRKMLTASNVTLIPGGGAVNHRSREQQLLESIDRLSSMIHLLVSGLQEGNRKPIHKSKRIRNKKSGIINRKLDNIQTSLNIIVSESPDNNNNSNTSSEGNASSDSVSARAMTGLLLIGVSAACGYAAYDGILDDSQLYAQSPATWDTLAATLAKATPDQISTLRNEVSKLSHQVVPPDPVVSSTTPLTASAFGFRPWTAPITSPPESPIWPDNITPQRSLHGGSFGASSLSIDQCASATLISPSPQPATGRSLLSEGYV